METQIFIKQKFAEFYNENATTIQTPPSIEQREFGFLLFEQNIMVRHKAFTSADDLAVFIRQTVPAHTYYSTAYYETPEVRMEEKGWLGADLYFDIDADHIPTKCGKVHDIWTCKDCGFKGRGVAPEECPYCSSRRFEEKTWLCEVCLETAKHETIKLVDILMEDFGFSSSEVNVSFSGHRGYHVHIEDEAIRELDSVARKEIVDYVTGVGLETTLYGFGESRSEGSLESSRSSLKVIGWHERIKKGAQEYLLDATEEDLRAIGLKKRTIDEILSRKSAILDVWRKSGPWRPLKGVKKEGLAAIIHSGIGNQSAKIDTVVTTDIHRLIRLLKSLHGKTGLLKIPFPTSNIEGFDPLNSALAFKKGETIVYIEEAPQFRMGNNTYGPFKKQKEELPIAAALFLLCKGAAKVVD